MERWTCAALAIAGVLSSAEFHGHTAPTPAVSNPDAEEFVMQAARATMLDIAASTRVEQKIQDPACQAYAQQVLGDDSKIEADLNQ